MIKEVSRRCGDEGFYGMACGPCGLDVVCGEIVYEMNGRKVFLTGVWVSEAPDMLELHNTEMALMDLELSELTDVNMALLENAKATEIEVSSADYPEYQSLIESLKEMIVKRLLDDERIDEDDFEDGDEVLSIL